MVSVRVRPARQGAAVEVAIYLILARVRVNSGLG